MSNDLAKDLLNDFGIAVDNTVPEIENESTFEYFTHKAGEYTGLVGELDIYYQNADKKVKDKDGKRYTKDTPGCTPKFAQLPIYIVKDEDGSKLINDNFEIAPATPFGKFCYRHYIPLEGEKQFQNKAAFKTFVVDGKPETAVVADADSKEFKVRLGLLAIYYGAPVKLLFEQGTKDPSKSFLKELTLLNANITKDVLAARKDSMVKILKAADDLLESEKAQREANRKEKKDKPVAVDAKEAKNALDLV